MRRRVYKRRVWESIHTPSHFPIQNLRQQAPMLVLGSGAQVHLVISPF
uniref:Uncharacterized protein n=1 Tax=Anguilla anguilla TaxID=7936 RepID=A0A0E9PX96_ANGAN